MNEIVSIIIPTWNNFDYLSKCIQSLIPARGSEGLAHIYVVNNGHAQSCDWIDSPYVTVLQAGDNLGWEGGLKLGLEHTTAPYVMFLNDDVHIPFASRQWIHQLLQHFRDDRVAAVGASTNVVMGMQNIFASIPYSYFPAKFLIGYCMLVRRDYLDKVGGVDDSLPGGDDLDLSIRFRDAGYRLIVDREVFIYHHGFKTGTRVHGDHNVAGGWNSYEFKEKTDFALIRKHGLRKWWDCMRGTYEYDFDTTIQAGAWEDLEGALVADNIEGEVVLDLGCGGNKTVPYAIGVDMIKGSEDVSTLKPGTVSSADVQADVSQALPFEQGSVDTIIARHVLEHLIDTVEVLDNWSKVLKPHGRLIIAVPNQNIVNSIPMNHEHVHAFTPTSLKNILEKSGFKVLVQLDPKNNVSFITIAEKQ